MRIFHSPFLSRPFSIFHIFFSSSPRWTEVDRILDTDVTRSRSWKDIDIDENYVDGITSWGKFEEIEAVVLAANAGAGKDPDATLWHWAARCNKTWPISQFLKDPIACASLMALDKGKRTALQVADDCKNTAAADMLRAYMTEHNLVADAKAPPATQAPTPTLARSAQSLIDDTAASSQLAHSGNPGGSLPPRMGARRFTDRGAGVSGNVPTPSAPTSVMSEEMFNELLARYKQEIQAEFSPQLGRIRSDMSSQAARIDALYVLHEELKSGLEQKCTNLKGQVDASTQDDPVLREKVNTLLKFVMDQAEQFILQGEILGKLDTVYRGNEQAKADYRAFLNDLENHPNQKTFFVALASKLVASFRAWEILQSGLVSREKTVAEKMVSAVGGVADRVPVLNTLGFSIATKAILLPIEKAIGHAEETKIRSFASSLAFVNADKDEVARTIARQLTMNWAAELDKITRRRIGFLVVNDQEIRIKKIADKILGKINSFMGSDAINETELLDVQIVRHIETLQGIIPNASTAPAKCCFVSCCR
jgi:hypothetical protein